MANTQIESKTILVVDDDIAARRLYREVFQNEGYNVLTAQDGLEGLDLAIREAPDLVFTGIIMPRMDGFELIRSLRKNAATSHIPVVMYSHLGREQDKRKAQDLGVKDFVVRSVVTPKEVVDRVKVYLGDSQGYLLEFDATAQDAAKLARDFDFPAYFECSGGKRMVLKLKPLHKQKDKWTFMATFECE
jgi:CheY-like chemotaxis protein